jgi:ribosomal protein L33
MAKGKKKRSSAYRLHHKDTGHHYVIRLSRDAFDKVKDKEIRKYNPVLKQHVAYKAKKI